MKYLFLLITLVVVLVSVVKVHKCAKGILTKNTCFKCFNMQKMCLANTDEAVTVMMEKVNS